MKTGYLIAGLILLGTMLAACGEADERLAAPQSAADENRLVIATFNVEDFENSGSYDKIARFLQTNKVDVVLFQEFQPGSDMDNLYDDGTVGSAGDTFWLNRSMKKAGYVLPYNAYSLNGGGRLDYVAGFSRYPIKNVMSVWPEQMQDPNTGKLFKGYRPILKFMITYKGRDIWFYNMHLKSNSGGDPSNIEMRRAQAKHLADYMVINHNLEKDLIVLGGDFNSLTNDYDGSGACTLDYLCLRYDDPFNTANNLVPVNLTLIGGETNAGTSIEYASSNVGVTYFDRGAFASTLDHLVASQALFKYVDYVKIPNDPSVTGPDAAYAGASDHYPMFMVLTNL